MNIKPLGNRVILQLTEIQQTTESGLIIPDSVKDEPTDGIVVAIGEVLNDDDKPRAFPVKVGDRVMFPMYSGMKLVGHDNYRMFNTHDLLGVIE